MSSATAKRQTTIRAMQQRTQAPVRAVAWRSGERHVLDGAGISIKDHLVGEPVDLFVSKIVNEGIADVCRPNVLVLSQGVRRVMNPIGLSHFLFRLVFLDRYVPLLAVLHVYARDLAVGNLGGNRVLADL